MSEVSLTLYIDLKRGARVDLEAAAHAALAWAQMIRAVGAQIDPLAEWQVELESALPGSQRLRSIIRLPSDPESRGVIKGVVIASLLFMLKETAAWGVAEVLDYLKGGDAPAEVSALTEEEIKALADEIVRGLRTGAGREDAREVYRALSKDPKVSGAGATSSATERPVVVVPRDQFPSEPEEASASEPEKRTITETVELTLIRPVLTADTSRRWGFQSRFGSFGAPIRDQDFLAALAEGRIDVPLSEGIRMQVEVEVTEVQDGPVWRPVERVVSRVLRVIPPPRQDSLSLSGP